MKRRPYIEPGSRPITCDPDSVKSAGHEALRRVKGDGLFEDWIVIGQAQTVITAEACAEIGVDAWDGDNKRLVRAFHTRWEKYEAEGGNDTPLSKQERHDLRKVMENLSEIIKWRATLDSPRRRRINHPHAVLCAWKAATKPRQPPRRSRQTVTRKNEQLEARVQELEEELASAREVPPVAPELPEPTDTIDDHVAALVRLLKGRSQAAVERVLANIRDRLTQETTVTLN
jgi:hypothetical protein